VKLTLAQAFDEWLREYWDNPQRFSNSAQSFQARKMMREKGVSEYGEACAVLLEALMQDGPKAWDRIARPEPPPKPHR
jgi:hypothetical protein